MPNGTDSRLDVVQLDPGRSRQELVGEVERLRLRVRQHEHTLTRLAEAVLTLRRGTEALREENRELRLALDSERRVGRPGGRRAGAA